MAREKTGSRDRQRVVAKSNPGTLTIQFVASVVMVVVGAYLTISQAGADEPSVELLVAGTALGTLGSVLFSWVLSGILEKRSATAELRASLKPISVNVGQYLGSIQNVVRTDWRDGELGGVRRSLREATEGIRLQISHIQALIGEDYAASETDKTLELLDEHWEKLDRALEEGDKRAVAAVRRDIEDSVSELKRTIGTLERPGVACPHCGEIARPLIRNEMGATVHVRCARCGNQFPVHRNGEGFVVGGPSFTTLPEASRVSVQVPIELDVHLEPGGEKTPSESFMSCTSCGSEVPVPIRTRRASARLIVCVNCGTAHRRDQHGTITRDSEFRVVEVAARLHAGSRLYSQCPTCTRTYPLLVKRGIRRFGFCFEDAVVFWSDDPSNEIQPV